MSQPLREGFTTGTSAAAAAAAAVTLLLGGEMVGNIMVPLPPVPVTEGRADTSKCSQYNVPLAFCQTTDSSAQAARSGVIKDGGDDPDATHGMLIVATVGKSAPAISNFGGQGDNFFSPGARAVSVTVPGFANEVTLYAGCGIGTATLPGLPIAAGEPAINPEPRKQIAAAASEAATRCGYTGPLHILIEAPEGKERALRTLNPRLGIVGGISILGTQGIVRPYSHDAWKVSILQGLNIAQSLDFESVYFSTGRRSERALMGLYPGENPRAFIQAADFASFSISAAASRGFRRIAWGCFPGKLLKLAQGLGWTHANNAEVNIDLLAESAILHGAGTALITAIGNMPTAAGAFALLAEDSDDLYRAVLFDLAQRAYDNLCSWLSEPQEEPAGQNAATSGQSFITSKQDTGSPEAPLQASSQMDVEPSFRVLSAHDGVTGSPDPELRLHVFSTEGVLQCTLSDDASNRK